MSADDGTAQICTAKIGVGKINSIINLNGAEICALKVGMVLNCAAPHADKYMLTDTKRK
ncbi:MAG: hypothetical protein ACOH5I_10725 [Oligoflexus sp.]